MQFRSSRDLLRRRGGHEDGKVAFVELFFDLVFVFAITQLSHALLHHFTLIGAVETLILFLAVWWVWIFTAWVTNWLDPRHAAVRLMLFALMLGGLVMSMAIPGAFAGAGLAFGVAIAACQVGRTLFMLWALAGRQPEVLRNFQRIACWLGTAAVFWVVGGLLPGPWRLVVWSLALAIEYAGPALAFWTPHLGRTPTAHWSISGGHMAERCGLFVIIALGESLLLTGATFAEMAWTGIGWAAFGAAFGGTVAMWWVYFHLGHERGAHLIERSDDPGRIARLAYTYLHLPLVAGIILAAASDEMLLAHPTGPAATEAGIAILGGALLFLAGNLAFKRVAAGRPPLSHLVGIALLGAVWIADPGVSALVLAWIAVGVLVLVAVWERLSLGPAGAMHG